jgi:hypothetical protein
MASYAYTFTSGDTVTPTKLNNARTVSEIVNADVSASAAIVGTKVSPNFGSQDVVTTGSMATGTTTPSAQLHITKAETTAYNGAATDGQVGAGATALIQQTAGSNTAVAQIVFQPRGSQPFNRIASSGGSAPFMAFTTNNEERLRVTSSGQMLVNTSAALPIGSTGTGVQIAETGLQLSRWNSASVAAPAFIYAGRSKSATIGTNAAVANNDELFRIGCYGADGTTFVEAARISALCDGTPGTNDMPGRLIFSTTADGAAAPTERVRIDSSGNIGIGSSNTTTTRVRIDGSFTGSTTSFLYIDPNVAPDMASAVRGCYTVIGTSANAGTPYTTNSLIHFQADQGTFNADSTVPTQYGFYVDSAFIGATNNFGVRLDIPAGTGRWNFYAGGTANNYFAGAIGIGVTSPDAAAALQINSTTQGFLPPRMTTAQRDAITTPPAGLMIYNTSTNKLNVRTASSWEAVTSA